MIHRRPKFRAAPESVTRMDALAKAGKIEMVVPYQLARLEGSDGQLSAVVVATLEGEERKLPADVLLPFFGLAMNLGPIAQWGIELDHNHIKIAPHNLRDQSARRLRHRRHRHISGQVEAYPVRILGGRDGSPRHPSAGPPRRGTALRVLDDEGRATRLTAKYQPAPFGFAVQDCRRSGQSGCLRGCG